MAIFMGNQVAVVVGTTNTISTFVQSVSLNRELDVVDITAMTDTVANSIAGVERSNVTLELYNDFAASSVNPLFENALGTKLNLILIPVSTTVSATNPRYTMSCLISNWTPINGVVDGVATVSATFPITAITKATS